MSHDIRTPMNAIIGLTHLAKSEDDLQTVRGYLHKIDSSSKFLLGLIHDILDMSKIENGEMILNEAPFSYGEFKESIQTVIMPLIIEKNINFVFEMGGEQDCLMVDKLRFCQIFFNLLSNAAAVPIIAMTAEAFDREKAQTLDAGINAHIAKPIDVEILKKAIRSQLEKATA